MQSHLLSLARRATLLTLALAALALLAVPASADTTVTLDQIFQAADAGSETGSCNDGALTGVGNPEAEEKAPCWVTVACQGGSTVMCDGNNSCSTSGSNNQCVTCDGVQQGCCTTTCQQCHNNCYNNYLSCSYGCGGEAPPRCDEMCENQLNWCEAACNCTP